ncbi:hypothetical protein AB0L65_57375 [Nonomuraea sp. NPDC052116]|uniref:hypothetical protein n=1 Tax=Nonomuraea sp. NPDC052116 TaxID=3155665 RepID=UPI00343C909A
MLDNRYLVLALHLQMHEPQPEDSPLILHRLAGWPLDFALPDVCCGPEPPERGAWVPVCVLGPLAGPRRLDLKNAVSAFTKHRLEAGKGW